MDKRTVYITVWDDYNPERNFTIETGFSLKEIEEGIEDFGRSRCAYCNEMIYDPTPMKVMNHITTCENRPEKSLLEKAFEVENRLFQRIIHLTQNPFDPENCETCQEIRDGLVIYNDKGEDA